MSDFDNQESCGPITYAIYGRYSSCMQRPATLEDQTRSCETAGEEKGWVLLPGHVYNDAAITGTSTVGRHALDTMLTLAKQRGCPFNYILVDDSSRLGRNLGDVLKMADILKHHRVGLYFVSQKLDSADPNFRLMLTVYGMSDEQQIERMRTKVHSGQKGRVLQGFSSGSRCLGYRSVVETNPDMPFATTRAGMAGVKWEIIEEEASVIRRIFDLFGEGYSIYQIVCAFNKERIRGPRKPKIGNASIAWNGTLVKNILKREKYRGVIVWNQTTQDRDPETGQVITRHKRKSEHVRVEAPHLRIVTDEQWSRVAEKLKKLNEKNAGQVKGGLNRAKKRFYLFSGLLICGVCGEKMRIAGGKDRESNYECPSYRYKRGCTNSLHMREDRLCEQLLDVLANRLLAPENFTYLINAVWNELEAFLDRMRREGPGDNIQQLERMKVEMQLKIQRLINFISDTDRPSESVRAALGEADAELKRITEQLRTMAVPVDIDIRKENLESIVAHVIGTLQDLFKNDAIRARELLQHYVKRLVLYPEETENGPVFEVVGEMDLFSAPYDGSERVLLDHCSTAMVQQHTSDCLFRFCGLQLFVRKDIHDHPLADFFDKLFENNPEAAQAGHNSKEWADLLRSVVPVNSEVDSRLNFMYVSKAFDLSRDIFERRFGLSRTVNSHTGKISWHLAPARLAT
jgi:DNA invertase Pin-like site-specific DNA recombinase